MNELNKLIEKWCGEEGTPAFMIHALIKEVEDEKGTWLNKLLLWLASRPTCGEEQRKFLDEVEKFTLTRNQTRPVELNLFKTSMKPQRMSYLHQFHFTADLQKVINGE